jgi:hypothetical protein
VSGTSPLIVSNNDDDDLVSVSELFTRTDPTAATATATPAAAIHKRQVSEAMPRDERPNRPETTPAALAQQQASGGGVPTEPRGQIQAQVQTANDTRKSGRAQKTKRRN